MWDKDISGTNLLNQGVYEIEKPPSSSKKASLAEFQWIEWTSGDVAAPTSPIEPALESGDIVKKGTAEVIVFKFSPNEVVWEKASILLKTRIKNKQRNFCWSNCNWSKCWQRKRATL